MTNVHSLLLNSILYSDMFQRLLSASPFLILSFKLLLVHVKVRIKMRSKCLDYKWGFEVRFLFSKLSCDYKGRRE